MTTSNTRRPVAPAAAANREPLRLRMGDDPGRDGLDGGWWPQSRDLAVELADLVDGFPPEFGLIGRALVSPPDWDAAPPRVPVGDRFVTVGCSRDDPHLVCLTTSDRTVLRVLVIPPTCTRGQGEEALLAAATRGNVHSATQLLTEVTDHPDVDPLDLWSDDLGRSV